MNNFLISHSLTKHYKSCYYFVMSLLIPLNLTCIGNPNIALLCDPHHVIGFSFRPWTLLQMLMPLSFHFLFVQTTTLGKHTILLQQRFSYLISLYISKAYILIFHLLLPTTISIEQTLFQLPMLQTFIETQNLRINSITNIIRRTMMLFY